MTSLFSDVTADRVSSVGGGVWIRRGIVALFAVWAALAAINTFGQEPVDSTTAGAKATLHLSAPTDVRGGLFWQAVVEIRVKQDIEFPRLVLDEGWTDGMQVNSIEPAASSENSRDGKLELSYDKLSAGDFVKIWFQFEADATYPGTRSFAIELDDQTDPIARISRDMKVWP
jgi:hypothetical protein